jgi:hypothetical protein
MFSLRSVHRLKLLVLAFVKLKPVHDRALLDLLLVQNDHVLDPLVHTWTPSNSI